MEFRPTSFQILPTVVKNIIIINVLVFLAQNTLGTRFPIDNLFALHTFQSPLFRPWQFFTYMFMHGSIMHIFMNMFAVWTLGSVLENLWGPKRFINFYLITGLGAALFHMVVLYYENQQMIKAYSLLQLNSGNYEEVFNFIKKYGEGQMASPASIVAGKLNVATLGASGAVFGCLAAFGYLFPNTYLIFIFLPFPIKAKWFVLLYIGGEIIFSLVQMEGDDIAHLAHLGGAAVGFLLVYFWNKTNRKTFY